MINLHPHLGPFGWLLSLAKWLYPCDRPRTHKLTPFRPVHVPCFCFDAIDNKESGWKLIAAAQEKKGHDPHGNKYPVASTVPRTPPPRNTIKIVGFHRE